MEKLAKKGKETTVNVNVTNEVNIDKKLAAKAEVVASTEAGVKGSGSGASRKTRSTKKVQVEKPSSKYRFKTLTETLTYDFPKDQEGVTGIVIENARRILKDTRKKYSPTPIVIDTMHEDGEDLILAVSNELEYIKDTLRGMKAENKELDTKLYNIEAEATRLVATNQTLMSMLEAEELGV